MLKSELSRPTAALPTVPANKRASASDSSSGITMLRATPRLKRPSEDMQRSLDPRGYPRRFRRCWVPVAPGQPSPPERPGGHPRTFSAAWTSRGHPRRFRRCRVSVAPGHPSPPGPRRGHTLHGDRWPGRLRRANIIHAWIPGPSSAVGSPRRGPGGGPQSVTSECHTPARSGQRHREMRTTGGDESKIIVH
jgi:hypothetical protein